jgi:hypothetical protein
MVWLLLTVAALTLLGAAAFGGVGGMSLALLVVGVVGAGWLLAHFWRQRSTSRL